MITLTLADASAIFPLRARLHTKLKTTPWHYVLTNANMLPLVNYYKMPRDAKCHRCFARIIKLPRSEHC